ncbi:hypothetical protein [Streptomyces sp. DH12]|uniref:hypothetical protein n=1 Tax=Streptomyces sp. DH12 TaxID=2857010 RepID=UPI001E6559FC|nr:hypothetical protein [Streptomyces sp. DH12]
MMTIRVYAVRSDGTSTTIRERRTHRPDDWERVSAGYPPCSCARCVERRAGR